MCDSNFGKFPESLKDYHFWKFYLATIDILNCCSIKINMDPLNFKICDSNFGKFPESLKDYYFWKFYSATKNILNRCTFKINKDPLIFKNI